MSIQTAQRIEIHAIVSNQNERTKSIFGFNGAWLCRHRAQCVRAKANVNYFNIFELQHKSTSEIVTLTATKVSAERWVWAQSCIDLFLPHRKLTHLLNAATDAFADDGLDISYSGDTNICVIEMTVTSNSMYQFIFIRSYHVQKVHSLIYYVICTMCIYTYS